MTQGYHEHHSLGGSEGHVNELYKNHHEHHDHFVDYHVSNKSCKRVCACTCVYMCALARVYVGVCVCTSKLYLHLE